MAGIDGAQRGLFRQLGGLVKSPPNSHAHYDGRAGVGARFAYGVQDKILDSFHAIGRGQHTDGGHVFTAEPLASR